MALVEVFMEKERSSCNWLDKLLKNYPEFYFAKDIKTKIPQITIDETFKAGPSKLKRIPAFLLICVGIYFWLTLLLMILKNILLPVSIAFILLTTLWIFSLLWVFFLNPRQSYQIVIDKAILKIGGEEFEWNKISDFLLMEKGSGRHQVSHLVLFINNKDWIKYNLTNLNRSGGEILKAIDFFKQTNANIK